MKSAAAILAFVIAAPITLPAWADCPLDLGRGTGWVLFSDQYMIAFRPDPIRIEVGAPFSLVLNICTKKNEPAELVSIEATMPEHKHGMNYKPTITAGADGRYRADGFVFHMPGRWELNFDVRSGAEIEKLSHDILLK